MSTGLTDEHARVERRPATAIDVVRFAGVPGLRAALAGADVRLDGITDPILGVLVGSLTEVLASGRSTQLAAPPLERMIGDPDRARELVQTAMAAVMTETVLRDCAALGVEAVRWLGLGSGEDCDLCGMNARAAPVPLRTPFPSGHIGPPAHPSCHCGLVPVRMRRPAGAPVTSTGRDPAQRGLLAPSSR